VRRDFQRKKVEAVAISLGSIYVELLANTSNFISGLDKASYEAKKSSKEIQESLSGMGDAAERLLSPFGEIGEKLGAAFGGIGQTISGVQGALKGLAGGFGEVGLAAGLAAGAIAAVGLAGAGIAVFAANAANQMYELSEKTGVGVESLSRFAYAAGLNGISAESMGNSLEKLNKSIYAAAAAPAGAVNGFTRLGVSLKDSEGNLRSTEDILLDLADKFQKMPEGPARGALAMQLFGRAGSEMLPFLIQGKAGISALTDEADKLGVTLGQKTASDSHTFEQTLKRMQGALQGAANTVLKEMLPSLQAFADFILNDLKDPSSVFRSIGRVLLDVVVPAFKILAGVVGTVIAAGDIVASVFGHAFDMIESQVLVLINAFSALKSGNFKQAGNEIREGFKQGLEQFTKGVTEDTDKANQRLAKLYGGLIYSPDENDQSKHPEHHGGGKVEPTDKSNPIKDRIAKLQEAAAAEAKLAGTVDLSTAAIRVQNEQNEIAKTVLELKQEALKKNLRYTDEYTAAVTRAVIAASEFKAAFQVRDEIEKASLSLQQNADKVKIMTAAYSAGGDAILDAQAKITAAPLQQKVNDLSTSLELNRQKLGENSDEYKKLAADLKLAQSELDAYTVKVKESVKAQAAEGLAQGFNNLRATIASLQITGAAIGGTTEQLRQAQVQAQLTQYQLTHIGVDTTSKEWQEYAASVEEASKQTEDNRIKQEALKYDLDNTFKNAMTQLQQYRNELVKMGADTTAVDAAIVQENLKVQKSYAQNLLQVGGFSNGAKAFFIEFQNDGQNAATAVFDAFKTAFDGLTTQLTDMVVKGKANFAELGQSIESSIVKSSVTSLEKTAVKGLGSLIPGLGGILGASGKRDGSTQNQALYITFDGTTAGIPGLSGGLPLGGAGFTDLLGGSTVPGSGGAASISSIGGAVAGLGSFAKSLGSIFGGFLAGGGTTEPGKAYVVGEKRPELFVPGQAGRVIPSVASGNSTYNHTAVNMTINTPDADSFRRSQGQISSQMGAAASRGQSRNGR
jgi:hypothetical protein